MAHLSNMHRRTNYDAHTRSAIAVAASMATTIIWPTMSSGSQRDVLGLTQQLALLTGRLKDNLLT